MTEKTEIDIDELLGGDPEGSRLKAIREAAESEAQRAFWTAAYAGPAPHINQFLITRHDTIARLAFVEQSGPYQNLQSRGSVSMSLGTLAELHETLGRFLVSVRHDLGMPEEPDGQ